MADKASRHDRTTDRNNRNSDSPHDLVPDLYGVTTRVSWSAIVSGAVIALATFFALSLFFSALGLTMGDIGTRARDIGYGALAAAIFSIVIPACARIVEPRPRQWTTPRATIAAEATAGWATAAEASPRRNGASRYFAAADAEAAIGPPKPIRNETQPVRKAASGPYASWRKT